MDTWEKRVYQAAYSCRRRIYKKVVSIQRITKGNAHDSKKVLSTNKGIS